MSANAPWSVKGIDAKAREVAKDLARRSGLTLGEWLNQMILKGEDVGALISRERAREQEAAAQYAESRQVESRAPESRAPEPRYDQRRAAPAYEDDEPYDLVRPAPRAYREEPQRPAAPFSTATASRDVRRRSIFDTTSRFESRPRYDDGYEPEGNELTRVTRALESLGSRIEQSETRSAGAVRGVSHAVESLLGRLERSEAAQAETQGRLEEQANEAFERLTRHSETQGSLDGRLEQAERLIDAQAERLEGLSGHLREERERIERVERHVQSPQAQETVRAVEGALGKLANQLYEGDARTRDSLKDVGETMLGLSHRLAQLESRDPERAAQTVIDKVIAQLAHRLEAAEAQTTGALRTLEQAFTALDGRINRMEERGDVTDPSQVASLKSLAAELQRKLEDSRAEIFNTLNHQTEVTLERALSAVNTRIEQSEKRQALAIERMGLDVVRVADTLTRRVGEVEDANSEGLTRMGQELNRIGGGIEARFGRAETSHAQALERLGNEIARISERLSAKIVESERRTTTVLGGVGEQIEQTQRHGRAELETRIRMSEERTQKLLEETRARIDSRLAQVQTQLLSDSAPRAARPPVDAGGPSGPFGSNPFAAPVHPADEIEAEEDIETVDFSRLGGGFDSDEPVAAEDEEAFDLTGHLLQPAFSGSGFKPEFDPFDEDGLEAEPAVHAHRHSGFDDADPFAEVDAARKTSAHARSADDDDDFGGPPPAREMRFEEDEPGVSVSTRDALAAARAAVRASMNGAESDGRKAKALGGLKAAPSKSRGAGALSGRDGNRGSTLGEAVKASAVAVGGILVVGGLGFLATSVIDTKPAKPVTENTPVAAAVLTPEAASQGGLNAEYLESLKLLTANAPGAVDRLRMVAEQGYAPAQEKLGELYDDPKGVMPADKTEAFNWTRKAAEGGLAGAMNRLGMMYYEGNGVSRDPSLTAVWLRRAAKRGEVDSAFNLGALYMKGEGVPANPSEAYMWMLIAAKLGDRGQAAQTATGLKAQLTDAQVAKVHDEVESFQPLTDNSDLPADQGSASVSASQSQG